MNIRDSSILLVLPVPFMKSKNGQVYFEKQACNGLRLWRKNFARVVVAAPCKPGEPSKGEWIPLPVMVGVDCVQLPYAYHPVKFIRTLRSTRRLLRDLISQSRYLQFAVGGLIGDWALIACLEAIRSKRPYSVWTDNVGSEIVWLSAISKGSVKSRLQSLATFWPTKLYERHVIKRSALGLFHGQETYSAYAEFCPVPRLVHNVHLGPEMIANDEQLQAKARDIANRALRICYAGRVESEKGPQDWIAVLQRVKKAGCNFTAIWIGTGSLLEEMRSSAKNAGLQSDVEFLGRVDHGRAVSVMKESDLMLFCHKLPESPRCLIESLMSGTPIVGYDGHFPRDIISSYGGGVLTNANDIEALARAVIGIDQNRGQLPALAKAARNDGSVFNDEAVFRHRSDLIKEFL
jgi:colanic acid/amylovoran biosynthesis glycosyltransferase